MDVPRISLLVVEDEQPLAALWADELAHAIDVTLSHSLDQARDRLRGRAFDSILLDLHLPDGNGIDLLREIGPKAESGDCAVIILTGNADLDSAIQALRLGACDYLLKPCKIAELEQHLARIAREKALRDQNLALRQQLLTQRGAPLRFVGESPQLAEVRRLIDRVAPTGTSVLIHGETGTGKEVAARLIHAQSARKDAAFVPNNCAALPRELVESELFGHRRGAFTGADRDHRGLIQAAGGGSLFLDEIGDLPLDVQAKFLRLLESHEGRRVGDTDPYRADVRVIAATNHDLKSDVSAGRFRQDLYFRLTTFEIRLPALRHIPGDLPAIAQHLLDHTPVPGAAARRFSPAALAAMSGYDWPGNVRELRNVIERAKILCDQEEIAPEHLHLPASATVAATASPTPSAAPPTPAGTTLADMEWQMIQNALAAHANNKTAAARALGISLRTLYNKLDARAAAPNVPAPAIP